MDGEIIQQRLTADAMTELTATLAGITLESGQNVEVIQSAPGVTFVGSKETFGFFMSVQVQQSEIVMIQNALALAWNIQYDGMN